MIIKKIAKALRLCLTPSYYSGLLNGVAASIEHTAILKNYDFQSVVDIGANKGQFALLSRKLFPTAIVYSFEPLESARHIFSRIFSSEKRVKLYGYAIGDNNAEMMIHVSKEADSSSLLPISELQNKIYPGTYEVAQEKIKVATLDSMLKVDDINSPALLKIDVQGFESSTLAGCANLLRYFNVIYIELSFMELYRGQALADEIIYYLHQHNFSLGGIYNVSYDAMGKAVQADFLFNNMATDK